MLLPKIESSTVLDSQAPDGAGAPVAEEIAADVLGSAAGRRPNRVAHADVQQTVGPELQLAAVVIRVRLVDEENLSRAGKNRAILT
jgi:hypothetical protein